MSIAPASTFGWLAAVAAQPDDDVGGEERLHLEELASVEDP
jgi:hypothetical protein